MEDRVQVVSRFKREAQALLARSREPPQLGATLHEPQQGQVTVRADVIRCRYTQFLENVHDIPVFSALDDIVETVPGNLGDYNFLHRTRDLRSPQKLLPYWGPVWYWRAETEWLLDVGIITWSEVKRTFTASAHFPPSYLPSRLEYMDVASNVP